MRKGQYQTNYFENPRLEPQANLSLLQPVAIDLSDGYSARVGFMSFEMTTSNDDKTIKAHAATETERFQLIQAVRHRKPPPHGRGRVRPAALQGVMAAPQNN